MPNPNTFESPLASKPDVFVSPLPAPSSATSAPVVHRDDDHHSEPVALVAEPQPIPALLPVTGGDVSGVLLLAALGVACIAAGIRRR